MLAFYPLTSIYLSIKHGHGRIPIPYPEKGSDVIDGVFHGNRLTSVARPPKQSGRNTAHQLHLERRRRTVKTKTRPSGSISRDDLNFLPPSLSLNTRHPALLVTSCHVTSHHITSGRLIFATAHQPSPTPPHPTPRAASPRLASSTSSYSHLAHIPPSRHGFSNMTYGTFTSMTLPSPPLALARLAGRGCSGQSRAEQRQIGIEQNERDRDVGY